MHGGFLTKLRLRPYALTVASAARVTSTLLSTEIAWAICDHHRRGWQEYLDRTVKATLYRCCANGLLKYRSEHSGQYISMHEFKARYSA